MLQGDVLFLNNGFRINALRILSRQRSDTTIDQTYPRQRKNNLLKALQKSIIQFVSDEYR